MGESSEFWHDFEEIKREKRKNVESKRVEYSIKVLTDLGYECKTDGCVVYFTHNNKSCHIYPYTGWWSGKGIGSDRGIKKLVKKLNQTKGAK